MDLKIGEVVISKSGRDCGKMFIVIKIIDEQYVMLCDGKLRKIERPKKKKMKHINTTGVVADTLAEKIANQTKIYNAEIQRVLNGIDISEEVDC